MQAETGAQRVAVLCGMSEAQRDYHVRSALEGLRLLPHAKALPVRRKMMESLLRRSEVQSHA